MSNYEIQSGSVQNMPNVPNIRWFAVSGDNGYGYTKIDGVIFEAMQKLKNLSVVEVPNEKQAHDYAYASYTARFVMRNASNGIAPMLNINLPPDFLFIR